MTDQPTTAPEPVPPPEPEHEVYELEGDESQADYEAEETA